MLLSMHETILIIAEHAQGRLRPITWEIVGFARQVQSVNQAPIQAIILGEEVEELGQEIVEKTGLDVVGIRVPGLNHYHGGTYTTILHEVIASKQPATIIAGHTSQGWDFAPRLAARLNTSCITNVMGLRLHQDRISFQHPIHGGRILAETVSLTAGTIVTIQPGAFREFETRSTGQGCLELLSRPFPSSETEVVGFRAGTQQDTGIAEADVIVAAGRGIGKQENLRLIHELAALFPRSAVGGSRPLCDQGWLRYSQQVGLTGVTVSPRLYIACGISGAYQHLGRDAGIRIHRGDQPRSPGGNLRLGRREYRRGFADVYSATY